MLFFQTFRKKSISSKIIMLRSYIFILLSFIFLISFVESQDLRKRCPDASKISPCVCHKSCSNCQPVISCSNLNNDHELRDVFQKSGDIPFYSVVFSNIHAQSLPGSSMEHKRYVRLAIVDSSLASLFDELPSEASLLQDFTLHNVTLQQGVQWELFSQLHSLQTVIISDTQVSSLDKGFGLIMPKRLKVIHFSNTNTTQIESHAFSSLKNLEFVAIRSTSVEAIDRNMFPKPFRAYTIDLSDNKIHSLPDDIFTDMPYLRRVHLNKNNLTIFKESVFGNLPTHLQYISIRDNPIRCDCSIKWITDRPRMPYVDGKCSQPEGLAGKKIRQLKKSDFLAC